MTQPTDGPVRHRAGASPWRLVHAERAALAADLEALSDEQWTTPSLCVGLSVREVLAHLTAGASLNPVRWLAGVIRCRFDFDAQVAMRLAEQLGDSADETLERFRHTVSSTTKPPLPVVAMLGEVIVHGEDIRRPLGLRRDHPIDSLAAVAEFYQRENSTVPSSTRAAGLRLTATDGAWSSGSGPEVSGPTLALIMAMAGRRAYCEQLTGDGLDALRERWPGS